MEDKTIMLDKTKVALIAGIIVQDGTYLDELLLKKGYFVQDTSKPDGTMRKIMDVPKIRNLGGAPGVSLLSGIEGSSNLRIF